MADKLELARQVRRALTINAGAYTDAQALCAPSLFPVWPGGVDGGGQYHKGQIVQDEGVLYRVVPESVAPQPHQPPHAAGMLAVYRPIEPEHAGTEADPIPWVYGMDCRAGQYFRYEGRVYRVADGGDMAPCIWAPGTEGLWQWELIA